MFKLHEVLKRDLIEIDDMKLSKVMLLPDTENPWAVIIPKREGIREIHELSWEDQVTLLEEINEVSRFLTDKYGPQKLNIGALGNMVPQLHVHIICRYESDRSWPDAIWGTKPNKEIYKISDLEATFKAHFGASRLSK
ncbi:scavenger mRNA decapping enzyme [Bacteriovorax sp. BAL6_X]|uniref:HIT family protein n=1 Tax=Bacteriovorax sp. BAL6_X TaxID=1201290 RepID=UPI0003864085|nr:HIT family protein [Bacteriovorax sp. BAL6_X]EPZ50074.1 scavenger mRNA decapping enzyme [Bacteriovorax sp. BAL6_X]